MPTVRLLYTGKARLADRKAIALLLIGMNNLPVINFDHGEVCFKSATIEATDPHECELSLETFLIVAGACLLAWRGIVAAQVALDARRRGFKPGEIGRRALLAVIDADRYWWGARLDRLAAPEARELLVEAARAHNLLNVANVRCPLCGSEIKDALAVADDGELYVRRKAACAHCDFRVDSCRHCAHFMPSTAGATVYDRH